jgi:hypothetical protein
VEIQELSMECTFLYSFLCYLTTLLPLGEYAQRKGNQIIPQTVLCKYMYLYILLLLPYTNFRALQILPPLTEISSSRFVRKGIKKDWFVIQLLV